LEWPCVPPTPNSGHASVPGDSESGNAEPDRVVTVSDHFKKFMASTIASPGGAIETAGAPLVTARFSHLFTSHAGFGNDAAGFRQHYGVNLLGNVSGILGKFVLPSALRQDEVYVSAGTESPLVNPLGHIVRHVVLTSSADHTHSIQCFGHPEFTLDGRAFKQLSAVRTTYRHK